MCLVSSCHFTFLCLVDLMFIQYVLWQIAKDFLCLEHITEQCYLMLTVLTLCDSTWHREGSVF